MEGYLKMAKYGKKAQEMVKSAVRRYKKGTLKSGKAGKAVKSREQAVAIGLSEAREKGAKVPKKIAAPATKKKTTHKVTKKAVKKTSSVKKSTVKKSSASKKTKKDTINLELLLQAFEAMVQGTPKKSTKKPTKILRSKSQSR